MCSKENFADEGSCPLSLFECVINTFGQALKNTGQPTQTELCFIWLNHFRGPCAVCFCRSCSLFFYYFYLPRL